MKVRSSALIVILLLLFISPSLAQSLTDVPASAFQERGLGVSVAQQNFTFDRSPSSQTLSIVVSNPTDSPMDVYLALYQNQQWNVLEKLGSIGAGAQKTFHYPVNFTYTGKSEEVDRFGVGGQDVAGYVGSHSP